MKKLFLFAALLMTGFAFYSCDDVVDNPAQDPAQSWNYSVSVKFSEFDLTAAPGGLTYQAPKTLYVLNEEGTLMGTIATDVAPAIGDYGTYAGTLTGTIGNNLIITTKIGNDLAKQDGTLESAIENGIVQTAEAPIKIYNANSGTLTTAAAKMENTTAIAHTSSGALKGGDKVSFISDEQSFEWTVNEEFDPTTSSELYIAFPTSANPEAEYTISTDSEDGFTRGATLKLADYPALATGKVSSYIGGIPFIETGVDLTIWDAYKRKNDASYMNNINNGYTTTFDKKVDNGKSFIVTQSGPKLDSLNVFIHGKTGDEIDLTLNNIQLGKDRQIQLGTNDNWYNVVSSQLICEEGAAINLTLIGETKTTSFYIACPLTIKGTGTIEYTRLSLDSYGKRTRNTDWTGMSYTKAGAATFTIDKNLDLEYINVADGATLNIADGKKINVTGKEWTLVYVNGTLKLGKGTTFEAENKRISSTVMKVENSKFEIAEDAIVTLKGAKESHALTALAYGTGIKNELTIGKNAKLTCIGGPDASTGEGAYFESYNEGTTNITLNEGAIFYATGIENGGIGFTAWNTDATLNCNIAKNAKIIAEDTGEGDQGYGMYVQTNDGVVNFTGEGTTEAKANGGYGMKLTSSSSGVINFKGGSFTATGGEYENIPAIVLSGNGDIKIAPEIKDFSATSQNTLVISKGGVEAEIDDLVADKTKFNYKKEGKTVTITPKPAAE